MTLDEKLNKIKELICKRDKINEQLCEFLGKPQIKKKPRIRYNKKRMIAKANIKTDKIGMPVDIKQKKWSSKYNRCIACGSDEHPHKSRGFCVKCYRTDRVAHYVKTGKILPKKKKKSEKLIDPDAPISSAANRYKCESCNLTFRSVHELVDTECPECKSRRILKI
ncbi:hypothetical protein KAU19_04115 [Candidatus Parcubacteria bacterium]|nr:hypothetical protein [Candidatus Parcubacteria bacterium]